MIEIIIFFVSAFIGGMLGAYIFFVFIKRYYIPRLPMSETLQKNSVKLLRRRKKVEFIPDRTDEEIEKANKPKVVRRFWGQFAKPRE